MWNINFWIFILTFVMLYSCSSARNEKDTKEFKMVNEEVFEKSYTEKIEPIRLLEGDYRNLKFSADGLISVSTNEAGDKLFLEKDNNPIEEIISGNSVGSNFSISKDGSTVFYRFKTPDYKMQIQSYEIATGKSNVLSNLSPYTDLSSLSSSDTSYYLEAKTMEVMATNGKSSWSLTNDGGNYYKILVSPNLKYLLAHKGSFIFIISTQSGQKEKIGSGLACDWSPNSSKIIGFIDKSDDGHSISSSDLFLIDVVTKEYEVITKTPNVFEMYPSFKNGKTIVFQDELNSGIYEMTLNLMEE